MCLASREINQNLRVFPFVEGKNNTLSWWIEHDPEPVLIDCPPFSNEVIKELRALAKGRSVQIILTNRDSHGSLRAFKELFDWRVLLQEQEAYLLHSLNGLETFSDEDQTNAGLRLFWTPGPSPGSCIIHAPSPLNVLFCGRLLLPLSFDEIGSKKNKKTFHWTTQQNSLKKVCQWIPSDPFPSLAPGAAVDELDCAKLFSWEAWKKPV